MTKKKNGLGEVDQYLVFYNVDGNPKTIGITTTVDVIRGLLRDLRDGKHIMIHGSVLSADSVKGIILIEYEHGD